MILFWSVGAAAKAPRESCKIEFLEIDSGMGALWRVTISPLGD
jgi:hypothetical protein